MARQLLGAFAAFLLACSSRPEALGAFEKDVIAGKDGDLEITFIGHGTLIFEFNKTVVHVDPWSTLADYSKLPKADIVLVTHEHPDHLDLAALERIAGDSAEVILTEACAKKGARGTIMKNGESRAIAGIGIEAVPAYNIAHKRSDGRPFHPKGAGNGYCLTFGDTRVYVAGDTENTPEMKRLAGIDIAFLPMNLPYTMTVEMVADAALSIRPKILYPYHFGETDCAKLARLLEGHPEIEVRIRKMM